MQLLAIVHGVCLTVQPIDLFLDHFDIYLLSFFSSSYFNCMHFLHMMVLSYLHFYYIISNHNPNIVPCKATSQPRSSRPPNTSNNMDMQSSTTSSPLRPANQPSNNWTPWSTTSNPPLKTSPSSTQAPLLIDSASTSSIQGTRRVSSLSQKLGRTGS